MAGKYRIDKLPGGVFALYEEGALLVKFKRQDFREKMESVGRSSNWVGAILKLFDKAHPRPETEKYYLLQLSPLEKTVRKLGGVWGVADYLKAKGFRVCRPVAVDDAELVAYMESRGYLVEGLLNGSYYNTALKRSETEGVGV